MCGIAGWVGWDGKPAGPEIAERVRAMGQAQSHRGPDGEGVHASGSVALGHRRLAIIDLESGQQPIVDTETGIALTYNGEVYNYVELRKELEPEYRFRTNSDTEVVLMAYRKWGPACVERFRGMFAFAIWDPAKKRVLIARDRLGIKPLFYAQSREGVAFASELKPLVESGWAQLAVDPLAVENYFRTQYIPAPGTIYRGVSKLPPAHTATVDLDRREINLNRYWTLAQQPATGGEASEAEWTERLDALLRDTVRLYSRADVEFGAFLSGGVDSSVVTAYLAESVKTPVRTFSIGFGEAAYSELPFARVAAERCKTRHFEKVVTPTLAEEMLAQLASHFGEPFGDSSAVPSYFVARESAAQVKMVLSGDGGDELFAGYDSYAKTFRDWQNPFYPQISWLASRLGMGYRGLDFEGKYDWERTVFRGTDLERLLVHVPHEGVERHYGPEVLARDPVFAFQRQDVMTYMVDDVLTKVDRMSMAASLEVRVPLLDHEVVEAAFAMPTSLKIRRDPSGEGTFGDVESKVILKRVGGRFYDPAFLRRKKMGFGIPVAEWLRGPLRPRLESRLGKSSNPIYEWIRPDESRALLRSFLEGSGPEADRLAPKIWLLMQFDLWASGARS